MKRPFVYALLLVAGVVAIAAYWFANRRIVVERPVIGGPPVRIPEHESLIGQMAPHFAAVDQNGHETGTSALRGRVVVLNVWAPWCRPCVHEMPRLEREIWQEFRPELVVVGVALGEEPANVRDYGRRANLTYPLVADSDRRIARSFGANNQIPQTFLIDRSGLVVYEMLGYDRRSFSRLMSAVQRAIGTRKRS